MLTPCATRTIHSLGYCIQIRKARDKLNQQIEAHKATLRDNEERNTSFLYEKAKVIRLNPLADFSEHVHLMRRF